VFFSEHSEELDSDLRAKRLCFQSAFNWDYDYFCF